jgi:hypothetical protein
LGQGEGGRQKENKKTQGRKGRKKEEAEEWKITKREKKLNGKSKGRGGKEEG